MESISHKLYRVIIKRDCKYYWFLKYYLKNTLGKKRRNTNKIIMLRLDLMGDCTMFTSSAMAIRDFYKDRPMTIVCLSSCKYIFERLGIFDEIICVDFRPEAIDFKKLSTVIEKLRQSEYDILLQPQVSKMPIADIISAAIKCNTRITMETKPDNSSPKWIKLVNKLYDMEIPYPKGKYISEFDYYGAFVRGIGVKDYRTTKPFLPYNPTKLITGNYYVIYPGGSVSWKYWPAERYAKVADYIYKKTGYIGVILGVSSEHYLAENIKHNLDLRTLGNVLDLTGKTTVDDVIDIIGNAKLVLSNDTSGVHIACATNTPAIGIIGGGHYKRFLPYHIESILNTDNLPIAVFAKNDCFNCDWHFYNIINVNRECLSNIMNGKLCSCIENITAMQVIREVEEVICRGEN